MSQPVASSGAVSLLETMDGWRDPAYRAPEVSAYSHQGALEESAATTIQDALVRMFNPSAGSGAVGR